MLLMTEEAWKFNTVLKQELDNLLNDHGNLYPNIVNLVQEHFKTIDHANSTESITYDGINLKHQSSWADKN